MGYHNLSGSSGEEHPDQSIRLPAIFVGHTLGNYTLNELIGLGGIGAVYRAHDNVLDRDVAIKVLADRFIANQGYIDQFYREARAAARLVHPNIVAIYDVGDQDGAAYIAMEYVTGRTLKDEIQRRGPLPPSDIISIARQVLSGIEAAHRHRILHRDIKPENIMLAASGPIKVLDFGIARIGDLEQALDLAGEVSGTAEYMSPEQALGEGMDRRSDLYSLGVVLYEMLTGVPPFTGAVLFDIIMQHINDPPPAPQTMNPESDSDLGRLIMKALAKEPEDRYQNASELLAALESYEAEMTALQTAVAVPVPQTTGITADDMDMQAAFKRDAAGFYCDLIGRDIQLQTLHTCFDRSKSGEGGLVFLAGESGIGKTRLATECQSYAVSQGGRALTGVSFFQDPPVPYFPFIETLESFFQQTERGTERPLQETVRRFIETEAPVLKGLLPLWDDETDPDASPPPDITPAMTEQEQQALFEGFVRTLGEIARTRPLVLLLDDFHRADTASFHLMHYMAGMISDLPILVIVTYQPEEMEIDQDARELTFKELLDRMRQEEMFEDIHLERLPEEDIVRMLTQTLKRPALSDTLREVISQETEGNPFFIIETLKWLQAEGFLSSREGIWEIQRDIDRPKIPVGVYDILGRRLERLTDEDRELLQIASVAGQRFSVSLLSEALNLSDIQMLRMIHNIERLYQLVSPVGNQFQFEHTKIRDMLYEGLPDEDRRAYHLLLARCLENQHADASDAVVGELATHWYLGGDLERAIPVLTKAGSNAARIFALREAVWFYTRAIQSIEQTHGTKDPMWMTLMVQAGKIYYSMGNWDEAYRRFQATLGMGESDRQNMMNKAEAYMQMGRIRRRQSEWNEAINCYEESLQRFTQMDDKRGIIQVYLNFGDLHIEQGNWDMARQYYGEGLELAEQLGEPALLAGLHTSLGVIASSQGDLETAVSHYEICIPHLESIDDYYGLSKVYNNLGMTYEDNEDWEKALAYYDQALQLGQKTHSRNLLALVYTNSAKAAVKLKDPDRADDLCRRALNLLTEMGDQLGIAEIYKICGMIYGIREDWSDAESYLHRSRALFAAQDNPLGVGEVCQEMGTMFASKGDRRQAQALLEEARGIFQGIDARGPVDEIDQQLSALNV